MDTKAILNHMRAERDRLDSAIAALEGTGRRVRTGASGNGRRRPAGGRRLSAEAKRRSGKAAKKRWAAAKKVGRNRL